MKPKRSTKKVIAQPPQTDTNTLSPAERAAGTAGFDPVDAKQADDQSFTGQGIVGWEELKMRKKKFLRVPRQTC